MRLQPVRGTRDILADEAARHRRVVETARDVARRYGYAEISTPIFEFTEVFKRTLGETSDVVTKEMYTFEDRGGDSITLRPEGTAGIARALISGGLSQNLPLTCYDEGPMFRYERPQKGRYRQFHQIGVELLGPGDPQADVEVIALAAHILKELGLSGQTVLELNSLGDSESRSRYSGVLVSYFRDHESALSQDSKVRLGRNPLRILDSKDEGDRKIVAKAPIFEESFNQASTDFFAGVCAGLDALEVAYKVNRRLVRGLDYYCHTAFEFVTDELGAQGTVIAGGRYDGLVEMMGGQPTPGTGWAGGIERLALLLDSAPAAPRPVAIIPVGDAGEGPAARIANELRHAGYTVELGYRGNVSRRMKRANKLNARAAVFLGEDELARGAAKVRDLDSGDEVDIPLGDLAGALEKYR